MSVCFTSPAVQPAAQLQHLASFQLFICLVQSKALTTFQFVFAVFGIAVHSTRRVEKRFLYAFCFAFCFAFFYNEATNVIARARPDALSSVLKKDFLDRCRQHTCKVILCNLMLLSLLRYSQTILFADRKKFIVRRVGQNLFSRSQSFLILDEHWSSTFLLCRFEMSEFR